MLSERKVYILIFLSCMLFALWLIPVLFLCILLFLTGKILRSSLVQQAGFNMLIGLDQFANSILLGDPDETISSRTGRALLSNKRKWFVVPFGAFIDKIFHVLIGQRNHCIDAIEKKKKYREIWPWIKS